MKKIPCLIAVFAITVTGFSPAAPNRAAAKEAGVSDY
jgi:hypothetical protein